MDSISQKIDAFFAENKADILRDIGRLVAINSVQGEAEEGAPFGREPRRVLEEYMTIARELGLDVENCNDMLAAAQTKGESEEYIGIINHLDIVPALDGWNTDPFTLTERDGWLLGRGVLDDKGPAVLGLYIHKFLREQKIPLKYTLRCIAGTNEETDMLDAAYYTTHYAAPKFGFSSDGSFPVCNGEMGIYNARLISGALDGNIVDLFAGAYSNAIPNRAEALVKGTIDRFPEAGQIGCTQEGDCVRVRAAGVSGHCAWPEKADSAITRLVDYLLDRQVCTEAETAYFAFLQKILHASDGSLVGIASDDGIFQPLSIAGSVLRMQDGVVSLTVDCRYNTLVTAEEITEKLQAAAGGAAAVVMDLALPTFYTDSRAPGIQTCVQVFQEVWGSSESTFTMAGGTYAREFRNCVSFGPEDDHMALPDWVGPVHSQNEGYPVALLAKSLKIYILAVIRLQEL